MFCQTGKVADAESPGSGTGEVEQEQEVVLQMYHQTPYMTLHKRTNEKSVYSSRRNKNVVYVLRRTGYIFLTIHKP